MVRKVIAAGLMTGALLSGCSSPEVDKQSQPPVAPETIAPEAAPVDPIEAWHDALGELRDRVVRSEPMSFFFAENACIAWPNQEGMTLVKNPVVYERSTDNSYVQFFPFVAQLSDGPVIMNGPMQFIGLASEMSDFGSVVSSPGIAFGETPVIDEYAVVSDSADHAWLEADVHRLMDTYVLDRAEYDQTVGVICPDGQLIGLGQEQQQPQLN